MIPSPGRRKLAEIADFHRAGEVVSVTVDLATGARSVTKSSDTSIDGP